MTLRAVDVLGFAGGFTLGVVQAGFKLVGKRELKGGFGVPNCEANRHLLGDSWLSEAGDARDWSVVDTDVVFGNPPCSGFSVMSAKEFRGADSKINHCMWAFAKYVAKVRPQVAVFESVQQAHNRPDGLQLMRDLRALVEDRTGLRYALHHVLHNAYSVGGCSQRPRYFWVISQVPFGVEWPRYESYPTLRDAIGDLQTLPETWQAQPYRELPSHWSLPRLTSSGQVDGHISVSNPLTGRVRDLMNAIPWRQSEHIAQVARRCHQTHGKLPSSWRASEEKLVKQDFFMGFTTPVRWCYNQPARVITGGGLVMAVHPEVNRTFTHREVARVMGFPDDWLIEPLQGNSGLTMTWGKGITVDCGQWIGGWIREALQRNPGGYHGVEVGEREFLIDVTHAWKGGPAWYSKSYRPNNVKRSEVTPTRGRPVSETPEATEAPVKKQVARDEEVFAALTQADTRAAVAERHGLTAAEAYLSLDRLRKTGRVASERRDGKFVWFRPDLPQPVVAE